MTIWILAVLLLASLAGLGYRQGAIRVAFSFFGILIGALVAVPLGHLIRPGLVAAGMKNPLYSWLVAPVIAFVVVLIVFKVVALTAHKKVEVYYKYKAGDLRLALWERLNRRLGLCLGLANGLAYLVLISFVIYIFSYWTVQLAGSDSDPRTVRIFNRMGNDLDSTGMTKVARAIDGMPAAYYQTADIAGEIYHTPLAEARLSRYPGFLDLAERPEFQTISTDTAFTQLRLKQGSISEITKYPAVDAILKNPDLLKTIWATVEPNLQDVSQFLISGVSTNYSEKILGRWDFDVNGAIALLRKAKPNIRSTEMAQWKQWLEANSAKTTLVATTGKKVYVKNVPHLKMTAGEPPSTELQTLQGEWSNSGSDYEISLNSAGQLTAEIQGDRLSIVGAEPPMAFVREE